MTTEQKSASHSKTILAILLAPILYILSIGPAGLVPSVSPSVDAALKTFYAPVFWLRSHTPLEKPLGVYVEFWGWDWLD